MNKRIAAAMAICTLLGGCAGARVAKLAKCTGPARYANPYGSVLPTLPMPGEPAPTPDPAAQAAPTPPPAAPQSPAPALAPTPPPAEQPSPSPAPDKTSALLPYHPSC